MFTLEQVQPKEEKKEIKSITVSYWIDGKEYRKTVTSKKEAHKFVSFVYTDLDCDVTEIKFSYK